MGNANSNKKNEKNEYSNDLLFRTVNKISSDLILNTNNKDLLQFMNPSYCDKIINLTSNILNDNFTKNQLKIINNKIKKNNKKPIDDFIQNLKDIDDSIYDNENYIKKNDICKEIAIYYVKIVHIFSAIKIVIDTDDAICNKTKKFKYKKNNKEQNVFDTTISADICSKNKSSGSTDIQKKKVRTLQNENGIPELENLFKDKYIPETKEFVMSEKQKKEYENAVSKFYKGYTGNSKPDEIKRFSDIPILEYKSVEICKKMKDKSKSRLKGNSKNDNIVNFANHLATIMNNSKRFDNNLIDILNYLFIPNDSGKDYIINENISFDEIDKIIEKVRKIIMELYIICDKDYRKGIKLFEEILLDKNIELADRRLKYNNKNFNKNENENENDYYKKKEEEYKEKKISKMEKEEKQTDDDIKRMTKKEKEKEQYQKKLDKDAKKMNEKLLAKKQREQDEIDNEDKNIAKRNEDIDEAGYNLDKYNLNDKSAGDVQEEAMGEKIKEINKLIDFYNSGKCPFGHELTRGKCLDDCGVCDICDKDINTGEISFTCEICDFDICSEEHGDINIEESYYKFYENTENNKDEEEHMSIENNSLSKLNKL